MFPAVHGVVSQGGKGAAPPDPPTTFRYYRLLVTANNGRNTLNIAGVELRESVGGANAAVGGVASAASEFSGSFAASAAFDGNAATFWSTPTIAAPTANSVFVGSGFEPTKAFDANPSTFWSTATGTTAAWVRWDAGGPAVITRYRVRARADATDGAPKDWTLEYSDTGNTGTWVVADTVTGQTGWANGEEREFNFTSAGAHRYWRLNVTANNGRSTLNVAEISFNDAQGMYVWLQYDLGVGNGIQLVEYAIQAHADAADGAPKDWVLEASSDGLTWLTLHSVTGETGWAPGEVRAYAI